MSGRHRVTGFCGCLAFRAGSGFKDSGRAGGRNFRPRGKRLSVLAVQKRGNILLGFDPVAQRVTLELIALGAVIGGLGNHAVALLVTDLHPLGRLGNHWLAR